jgi:2-polyprenyl-3-methyl-5-hydroxy-6-metoxy-1,4-benzoquinol methylase
MILNETQEQRDIELSKLTEISVDKIKSIKIKTPESIRHYKPGVEIKTEENFLSLYKDYKYLDIVAYLKTLMVTSIESRHPNLISLINLTSEKRCLDFGSGVGTHAIVLLERLNDVSILDVPGPLLDFAIKRIKLRGFNPKVYYHDSILPENIFDIVICTDVLEHVYDPIAELKKITKSLKPLGLLHLQVSRKIKPSSGHFKSTIVKWKKYGPMFLKSYYKQVKPTIYRKNK